MEMINLQKKGYTKPPSRSPIEPPQISGMCFHSHACHKCVEVSNEK